MAENAILASYRAKTPGSAALAEEARGLFPSGVTHDARYLTPHGLYVERAEGAVKWDVDGNRYVDYFGGHGSLLLGHNHPKVVAAAQEALAQGTHFAAGQRHEIAWAKQVISLVPSAERVRFTASGTEATHMALRLARAQTGKRKIIRFKGQFHGWHNDMTAGHASHFDGSAPVGVPADSAANIVLLEAGDPAAVRGVLEGDADIAGIIIEPLGAATGGVPVETSFLTALRELSAKHGVILIFDEVVTGFRVSPGGVQGATGITPDLTALAKILAGGLPGGAVAGRKDLLDWLDFGEAQRLGREKIYHPGTYNANPVAAAAGTACLTIVGETDACERAAGQAGLLRDGMNEVLMELQIPWAVYGRSSAFHLFLNPDRMAVRPDSFDATALSREELTRPAGEVGHRLRIAALVQGIDLSPWPGGLVSAVHEAADIAATVEGFRESLLMLRAEGMA